MTDISTWNAVDDSNNAAAPAGWPEGMMPSGVNNAARAMQGALKRWRDQSQPTVTATGAGNAQIITYPVAPAALAAGDAFCFFALANTGPATLQVNAQAAKPITNSVGGALIGGEIWNGSAIAVVYDGIGFRMLAAPTPLSISNGGTGQTTPAAAADAIGAVKDTGDTMTGNLTLPGLTFTGTSLPGHTFAFGWGVDGLHVFVDGADNTVGDINSVTAGNGLTGGGSTGALSLAMSGSYSGTFTASNIVSSGTFQAAYVGCTGNMDVSGQFSAPNSSISCSNVIIKNNDAYYGRNTGGTPQHLIEIGSDNVVRVAQGAATVSTNAQFAYQNHLYCQTNGAFYCGLAANAWAGVVSFSYPAPSDRRNKIDIQDLPEDCASLVGAIAPKRFRWREGANALDPAKTHWGFIAQEVGQAFDTAGLDFGGHQVGDDDARSEMLDTNELVSVLWQAVRELGARVKQLEGG
jgi:hypothetical protein